MSWTGQNISLHRRCRPTDPILQDNSPLMDLRMASVAVASSDCVTSPALPSPPQNVAASTRVYGSSPGRALARRSVDMSRSPRESYRAAAEPELAAAADPQNSALSSTEAGLSRELDEAIAAAEDVHNRMFTKNTYHLFFHLSSYLPCKTFERVRC